MADDYPPNRRFLGGDAGAHLFSETHWIPYCSEPDEEQHEACRRMAWGAQQIERLGGSVDLFIRDPRGPHGGLMQLAIRKQALDLAETFVR